MQTHIILVPGFGGFDALGSLQYYDGVTEALESGRYPGLVHYFPNMPTASVLTRARTLRKWLSMLRVRRAIRPEDRIHLIGHSTGGLDLRQLLINLREEEQARGAARTSSIIKQIKTVQFLSTPHRGTALAHNLGGSPPRVFASQLVLRVLYEGAHGLRGKGLWGLGRGLKRLSPARRTPNWLDAVIDTLAGCYSKAGDLESAEARGTYSELLRWLLHMASDFSAITDLDPTPSRGSRASPAHASDSKVDEEVAFINDRKIRVRSIVTRASPDVTSKRTLFNALHWLTAHAPPRPLQRTCSIRKLWGDHEPYVRIGPDENDGLVNSVSQVWPDEAHSCLVPGDHADVIGHFGQESRDGPETGREYDLLNAPSGFDSQRFTKLWGDIAAFTRPWEDTESPRLDAPVERQRTAPPRDTDAAPLRICKPGK